MKPIFFFVCVLLLSTAASAGPSQVFLQVRVESESGPKKDDPKSSDESRARWLVVKVANPAPLAREGLTLKWTFYADDLKRGTDDIVVEKSGSESFGFGASGNSVEITTPKVVFQWTPQHSVRSGSGRRASYKRVDETGHRYHGYSVQILQDGVVIGEASNDPKLLKLRTD